MPLRGGTGLRPVRILWLIKGLGPGGAEQLLVASAQVADRERVNLEVAYIRPDKTHLVERLEGLAVPCHPLGEQPQGAIAWPRRLRELLAAGRYDVVHVHSPLLAGVARLIVASMPPSRRPAVVATEHSEWRSHGRATRVLNAVTAPLDCHRWAVSDPVRQSMWEPIARDTEVLVHGIALSGFESSPDARTRIRAELSLPHDAVVACTVANLRRQKDYPNLLAACRIAMAGDPALYVVAIGQGPMEAELRSMLAELGLGSRVQLLGYRTDVADVLSASDVFVLASRHEGLPLAMMEAMASGLPVVATAVGGIPEAVQSGVEGVLVSAGNSRDLAEALLEVTADPALRARMGDAARNASTRFDIRHAVERQCEVYEQLAKSGNARLPRSGS